jgi:SsrA-binding protein
MAKKTEDEGKKIITRNRKAWHDFEIIEQVEAGLVLTGSEVKSLRDGKVIMEEAYARIDNGEVRLLGLQIPTYANAGYAQHVPDRPRRCLLHRREIKKLTETTETERLTIVPLELYWKRGFCKVLLGTAKGKKLHDKRETLKKDQDRRAIERAMRGRD